jgi:hypothetical protein
MKKTDIQEAAISLAKSLFSAVPFAGGALNEVFFDYRSRIKQDRLNSFTVLLTAFFLDNPDIDPQSLKTEEFSDLFESVIRRVLQTKSREKHIRFRDVLIRQIHRPHEDIEDAETCLDLISTLNELAIWILNEHLVFFEAFETIDPLRAKILARTTVGQEKINKMPGNTENDQKEREKATAKLKADQQKVERYNKQVTSLQGFRKAAYYNIQESEYLYYKQTLYAKGLLVDKGIGGMGDSKPFQWMWITEFGRKFIGFIVKEH